MKINYFVKEKVLFAIMAILSLAMYAGIGCAVIFIPHGYIYLIYISLFLIFSWVGACLFIGRIKGNAIKISSEQFPEIHNILKSHAEKLELKSVPDFYLLQGGGLLNAFATRFKNRNFVVLYSSMVESAYQEGLEAISFILGHELGHIKRKHVHSLKNLLIAPARLIPFLGNAYSRACESNCDLVGYSLCPEGATSGILILAAGNRLYKNINTKAFVDGLKNAGFELGFAEFFSTHPALIKRLALIDKLNKQNPIMQEKTFTSPVIDIQRNISNVEQQQQ